MISVDDHRSEAAAPLSVQTLDACYNFYRSRACPGASGPQTARSVRAVMSATTSRTGAPCRELDRVIRTPGGLPNSVRE